MCGLCRAIERLLHKPRPPERTQIAPEMLRVASDFRKASTDHMASLWVRETQLHDAVRQLRLENERLRDLIRRQELHMLAHGLPMPPDDKDVSCRH